MSGSSRSSRALAVVVAILTAAGLVWALRPGAAPKTSWKDAFHDSPEVDDEVRALADASNIAIAVALARTRLAGGEPRASVLDQVPGSLVYLCAYHVVRGPLCATGVGQHLGESVVAAAAGLDPRIPDGRLDDALLKLDVVLGAVPSQFGRDSRPHDAGAYGFAIGEAVVLPSEVLEADLFGRDDESDPVGWRVDALLRLLGNRGAKVEPPFDFDRIRTAAWVEARPAGPVTRLYRLHPFEQRDASDPRIVFEAAVLAAEHLAGTVTEDGRIRYTWDTRRGRERPGYNLLRHGGTTYSLLQAYERTRHEPWLRAARAAIGHLLSKSARDERNGPYGGGEVQYVVEGTHIKLGGAGLALVALATHQRVSGDARYLEDARAYARYLVSQQQQGGEFVYFASREPGGEPRKEDSAYYPGEAILGLMMLHELDPEPLWLQTAVRGADWLIEVRDRGKAAARLANDHWLMIALARLYEVTRDERYVEHAIRLARAVEYQAGKHAGHDAYHRDYLGGYYEPPRSTPAATRAEGLVAVLDTCALAGRDDCGWVRDLLVATVAHMMQSQYTPEVTWWMPAPGRVVGGFSGGIVDVDLRNDFTQHALSALLGTERHLGRAELDFEALRAPLVEMRGPSRWEPPQVVDTEEDSL